MFQVSNRAARSVVASRTWGFAALASVGVVTAWSSSADAASAFGRQRSFSIGVERVFGVYSDHYTQELDTGDVSGTSTSIGLLYQEPGGALSIPRVTFDFFLIDHLSLGTALGYYAFHPDTNVDVTTGFLLAPRVGYAFALGDRFGIMPHAGITYVSQTTDFVNNQDDFDRSQLLFALDGTFYFMPVPNVGFTGAVVLDLGVTGSQTDPGGAARDGYREQLFGVTFGMFAHF
jgi:hypothetical protein